MPTRSPRRWNAQSLPIAGALLIFTALLFAGAFPAVANQRIELALMAIMLAILAVVERPERPSAHRLAPLPAETLVLHALQAGPLSIPTLCERLGSVLTPDEISDACLGLIARGCVRSRNRILDTTYYGQRVLHYGRFSDASPN